MIAVIGAGPAGLLAAWHAARAGHDVTVVDGAPVVGGLAGSFDVAGQRVDHGSHRLHPSTDPSLLAELRSLLGEDLQVRTRSGRIAMAGRLLSFPLRTTDLLRNLPRPLAARMALDATVAPLRRPRADTYAEVVRAGLGPTVQRSFYGPYAHKLWGCDGGELAGEVARRRIAASSPMAIARKLVRAADPGKRTFLYPRRGFGQLSERLADAAVDAGATIRLGTPVTELGTLDAEQVWSTIPISAVPAIVRGAPDPVLAAAAQLQHRAMVLLYLVVDRPSWTDFDAHYFPEPSVVAARLSEPKRYRTSADDPADRTVLCAEVPCAVGDELWTADPAALAGRLDGELQRVGLPPVAPVDVVARHLPRVYPVYRLGYDRHLATLEAWVDSIPGLVTFGRQGLFVADNTHHVLAMGRALAATGGGPAWPEARQRFRDFVVED